MIMSLFRKDPAIDAGAALYMAAVDQARAEPLYTRVGVPDTVEGRFEMVSLHVYLVLRRLKGEGAQADKVGQKLFDAMFQNMDDSLRELGVGDLSVGKKIRKLAENFYGRVGAYEDALADSAESGDLAKALGRNIFLDPDALSAEELASYVRRAAVSIEAQPAARIAGGIVQFPAVEEPA